VFLFSLGLMVTMQHLQMKFYSAKDPPTIKWSGLANSVYLSAIYIPPVLTGLTAALLIHRGALPPVSEIVARYGTSDAVLPLVSLQYAPALLVGLLFAGAVAAATSTKDNFLMATAVVLTRDLYQRTMRPKVTEPQLILFSRIIIVAFGLVGWYLAILRPGLIFDLVALAVAGTLQFIPSVMAVVFPTRKVWLTSAGAITGTILGVLTVVLLTFPARLGLAIGAHPWGLHAGMWGLGLNFLSGLIVSRFTPPPPQEAVDRIHGYLDEAIYGS